MPGSDTEPSLHDQRTRCTGHQKREARRGVAITQAAVRSERTREGRGLQLAAVLDVACNLAGDRLAVIGQCHKFCGEHGACRVGRQGPQRSEEHTSELQSLMRLSYAGFCLK